MLTFRRGLFLALVCATGAARPARSQQLVVPPHLVELYTAGVQLSLKDYQVVSRGATRKRLDSLTLWSNSQGWSERVGPPVWPIPKPIVWKRPQWEPPIWVTTSGESINEVVLRDGGKEPKDVKAFVEKTIRDASGGKDPLNDWKLVELLKREEWNQYATSEEVRIELLKKAPTLPGLEQECWKTGVSRLAQPVPNWVEQSPVSVRLLRKEIEAVLDDMLRNGKETSLRPHKALTETDAVSFAGLLRGPKREFLWGPLGAALSDWNELVSLLALRDVPVDPKTPQVTKKLPPSSAQLAAASDLVYNRLPKSPVVAITGVGKDLAKALALDEKKTEELTQLIARLGAGPHDAFGQPLRVAAFLTYRKEQLASDVQKLSDLMRKSLEELDAEFGKLAGRLPPDGEKIALAKLDGIWADLQRRALCAVLLRREAAVLEEDLKSALEAVFTGVRENVRNVTETLDISLGLQLEKVVRDWDANQGANSVTLRESLVTVEGGRQPLPKPADPEKAWSQASHRVQGALLRFWGPQPPPPPGQATVPILSLRAAAFKRHIIEVDPLNKNLVLHKRPTITQTELLNWATQAPNAPKAGDRVRVELFGHRIVLDKDWDLGVLRTPEGETLILQDLLIVASEVELGSQLSFAIPDGCTVTILTHGLAQKLDAPVPSAIMLGGPNAAFCCFSSQYSAAPQFIRVFGHGRFDFVGAGGSSGAAWEIVGGESVPVNHQMTEFWLASSEHFVSQYLRGTFSHQLKTAALLEAMTVPRIPNNADPELRKKGEELDTKLAGYRKDLLEGRLHLLVDSETGRQIPVYLESNQGLTAYLLPDELWIDDTQPPNERLGFLYRNGGATAYSVQLTLRAEVSRYAKTRGRSLVAARFDSPIIIEGLPPTKFKLAFSQAPGVQFLGPDCPVDEVGLDADKKVADATQNTTLKTKMIPFTRLVATCQSLCTLEEAAALTLELQKPQGAGFVTTEMQFKLPISFGRRLSLKPESITVEPTVGQAGQVTLKNTSRREGRILALVSGAQSATLVPVPGDCVIPGNAQKTFPLDAPLLKVISVRQQYTAQTNIYDLLSVTEQPNWPQYQIDLGGFLEAKIPDAKSGEGGKFLDLRESKVAIWYRNADEKEFVKWREWPLTEFRVAQKMKYDWHGPDKVAFRVVVECRRYGSKDPARRVEFDLDGKPRLDLSKTEEVNRFLVENK